MNERELGWRHTVAWIVAATALVVSIWTLPLSGTSANVPKLILILLGMLLALGAAAALAIVHRRIDVRIPWVFFGVLPLALASFISLFGASNIMFALASLLLILLYLAWGLIVTNVAGSEVWRRRILGGLIAGASTAAFIALLQYVGLFSDVALSPVDRIAATFGNRNFLGSSLGILAFPAAALFLTLRRAVLRALAWVGVFLCFFGPFLVQQTGIAVALLVGLLFLLVGIVLFRSRGILRASARSIALVGLAILLGAGTGLALWSTAPHEPVVDSDGSLVSDLWSANYGSYRIIDWAAGWEMFKGSPATGAGLGNYKVRFLGAKTQFLETAGEAHTKAIWRAEQAHNDYVQVAAELGIPGIIAVVACLLMIAVFFWRRLRRLQDGLRRLELLLLLAGVVVACAHAVVSFPFHLPVSALAVVTLLGVAASSSFGDESRIRLTIAGDGARAVALLCLVPLILLSYGLGREFVARVSFAGGISSMEAGDLDRAKARLDRSVSASSLLTEGLFWLATIEIQLADQAGDVATYVRHLESARDHADAGLGAYPTEEGLLLQAGIALRMNDLDLVDDATARLFASNPGNLFRRDAQILRASADARRGESDRAKATLREVIAEEPEYVHGYLMLASILRQEGDVAGERGVYEEGIWAMQAGLERIDREYEEADRTTRTRLDEERYQVLANLDLFITALGGAPGDS